MILQSLVLCSDEKIVRILRRVLSDMEIGIDHCTEPDAALHKLTRHRFEAVIVDCTDEAGASQVLKSARSAPVNKRAVALAIVDASTPLHTAFEMGANFVLYKPLSAERAKGSFRAARALMKRERRRNLRVPMEIPVTLRMHDGSGQLRATTADLGEGGIAVRLSQRPQELGAMSVYFTLPGTEYVVECAGEVAWENSRRQLGVRFMDLAPESRDRLKAWLESQSSDLEKDDPPVPCKLTDLSPGGCYLETAAPFPVRTRLILSLRGLPDRAEGIVRVMHPELGMGVELARKAGQQLEHVEKFIEALRKSKAGFPDVLVEPEGLDAGEASLTGSPDREADDPLLILFRRKSELNAEAFRSELRRQRGSSPQAMTSASSN